MELPKLPNLPKLTVIALILAARMCQSEIVVGSSSVDKSTTRLADDLINIVTSCYKGQINGVGLAGNLPRTLIRTLSVEHSIPVALIDNVWTFKDKLQYAEVQSRQKLNVFIIEASSFEKLNTLIARNIRYSISWNHMASFFILDLSPGCFQARYYALLAWKLNILNGKVMCSHHQSGRIIFNYNPFISKAPVTWQRAKIFRGVNKHPFTLLSREYQENGTICVDLDFDKTEDLGGYMVRVDSHRENFSQITADIRKHGTYTFELTRKRIFGTIFRALNATPKFVARYNRQGYDISASLRPLDDTWAVGKIMTSYPFTQVEISIITQFRGHKSQLNKILSVIDVDSRYGVGVVYLITLVFFKFFVHQALVPALLNLIRITSNTGFANLPNDTASRIYLGTLLFFVVTMQGIFQGDLAALLTKQIPLRNVDTIQDLEDLGYKEIYMENLMIHLFDGSDLKKKVIHSIRKNGLEHVKNDSSAACIEPFTGRIIDMVQEFGLHISRKPVELSYVTSEIRWSWPLEERVNAIIARMVEANVLEPWYVQCNRIKLSDFYVDTAVKNNVDFKNIEFHEVRFAFVILGIGLVFATIVFIIELATTYKCKYEFNIWSHVVRR